MLPIAIIVQSIAHIIVFRTSISSLGFGLKHSPRTAVERLHSQAHLQTPCQAGGGSVCVLCSAVLGRLAGSVIAFVLLPSPPHPTYDKNC